MRRIRRMSPALAVVAVLLAGLPARAADVLDQVPADALFVVKVNRLKDTSAKVAKLAQDLGLAQMAPPMADPLGFVQQQLKMVNGVNTAGDMALAYLDPATAGGDEDKSVVILIPVTDYAAFLGNWTDAKTEGAVSEVQMADTGQPGFVSNWGGYAALSPSKDVITNKPANPGLKFAGVTAKEIGAKDIILVANFKSLSPRLRPKLKEGREKMFQEMERELANEPEAAKFTPVIRSVMNQVMNMADEFLADSQSATVGVSLTNDGILTTVVADFEPNTYLGKMFGSSKNSADNKLAGLPPGKYLLYGGSVNDPQQTAKLLDDLALPVIKELVAIGPEFKAAQDYYDGLRQYVTGNTSQTFGLFAPSGALGAEALMQGFSIQRGDAPKMLEGYKKMVNSQQEIMKAIGLPAEQMKVTHTPNAKTVEGVSFDAFKSEFNLDPNDPSSGQANQFLTMLYGPNGATFLLGVADGNLIQAMGLKDESLTAAVTAARGSAAPLSELAGVKQVAANLPKNNLGVVYIPVDEIVNTGLNYAKQFGFGIPVQLPPDLPPIGASVATEGSALRIDVFVPQTLVQSMVAAGMQAAMQMRGGPGGGGGGL